MRVAPGIVEIYVQMPEGESLNFSFTEFNDEMQEQCIAIQKGFADADGQD